MQDESFQAGQEVLLRYRYPDGSVQAALPMRVVEHTEDLLVAWLAPGTPIMYWATEDGRDPRAVPLERRFLGRLGTAPRRWEGGGALHLIRPGQEQQVVVFLDAAGGFSHWYVNLERPIPRLGTRMDTVDRHLDLVIDAAGVARWKDMDEAVAAVGTPYLPLDDLVAAREAGAAILADVGAFLAPYRARTSFVPDPCRPVPDLPADWDA